MARVAEVIDLLDSDTEDGNDDEVVVVAAIRPPDSAVPPTLQENTSKKNKLQTLSSLDLVSQGPLKRRKLGSLQDATSASGTSNERVGVDGRGAMVVIDNDGTDNAKISPGFLNPKEDWIKSGSTSAIVQHIRQNDRWSCGYRNLQMMLSALLPNLQHHHAFHQKYPHRQDQIAIPSLRQIQKSLEAAWSEGFDPRGAAHYRYKLCGKRSWIGALEVSCVLSYWGIDSAVVQFIRCRESRELLSNFVRAHFRKNQGKEACPFCTQIKASTGKASLHVPTAFSRAQELLNTLSSSRIKSQKPSIDVQCQCPPLPLYLQWEGHSVTIVGMDETDRFLLFDPLKTQQPATIAISEVIKKDTQIVMVTSFRSMTPLERQERKQASESNFVSTAAMSAVARSTK